MGIGKRHKLNGQSFDEEDRRTALAALSAWQREVGHGLTLLFDRQPGDSERKFFDTAPSLFASRARHDAWLGAFQDFLATYQRFVGRSVRPVPHSSHKNELVVTQAEIDVYSRMLKAFTAYFANARAHGLDSAAAKKAAYHAFYVVNPGAWPNVSKVRISTFRDFPTGSYLAAIVHAAQKS